MSGSCHKQNFIRFDQRNNLFEGCSWFNNHWHNILRLSDNLQHFLITTSETKRDY